MSADRDPYDVGLHARPRLKACLEESASASLPVLLRRRIVVGRIGQLQHKIRNRER